jgi:NADPH:quinone reductase-like Zn-dependent oxidoreductase
MSPMTMATGREGRCDSVPTTNGKGTPVGKPPERTKVSTGLAATSSTATSTSVGPGAGLAWFVHGRLRSGEIAYVGGGAGNVGSAAAAMARRGGARVVASARPADYDRCREARAYAVVDYREPDLARRLRVAGPEGVDLFWETSGHHDLRLAAEAVAPGRRVLFSAAKGERPELPVREIYTRNVSLRGFVISRATVSQLAAASRLINTMLVAGELSARVTEVLPLAATAEVHARLEAEAVTDRLLLLP